MEESKNEKGPASRPTNDNIYIELKDKCSKYDQNYYCNIIAFEICEDKINIHIDMKGSNIYGPIQKPIFSTLKIANKRIEFLGSSFIKEDPVSGYEGYLIYKYDQNETGNYTFNFGQSGYSTVVLYTKEGINKY